MITLTLFYYSECIEAESELASTKFCDKNGTCVKVTYKNHRGGFCKYAYNYLMIKPFKICLDLILN